MCLWICFLLLRLLLHVSCNERWKRFGGPACAPEATTESSFLQDERLLGIKLQILERLFVV